MKRILTTLLIGCFILIYNGLQAQSSLNGAVAGNISFTGTTIPVVDKTGLIAGKVTTRDGRPAPFVTASLQGTTLSTTTQEDGSFVFDNLVEGKYTLIVSNIGLETKESLVEVVPGKVTSVQFTLVEDFKTLAEVVITPSKMINARVVSVGKVNINPMDLPQSISVIGQNHIKAQQAGRLSDVIRNVNGIYLATTRASTQESFSGRGYSFGSNNLFKNGARVNSGAMPEVSSLEKVEVLKGSAAILYGNVAPGGIVNMVTKQPKFNFGGEVSLRVGSYNLIKPTFDIYGPISSGVAFRINGAYESAGSYRDVVESDRVYINPSLLFKLGKRTELLVQGDYLQHEFTPDFGIGSLNNTKVPDVPRSRFMGATWQYAKTKQATATASLKHSFNEKWKLHVTTSYQDYSRDYYSTERIQADANGNWARPLGRQDNREDYYMAQIDINGKFKTGKIEHTLLAGIDADRYYTTAYTFNQPAIYDSFNILNPSKYVARTDIPEANRIRVVYTPTNRIGAYVQDLISLSAKFKVLLGVRYSYQEARPAETVDLLSKNSTFGKSKYDDAVTPRVGLVYRPVENTSFFASYANSFTVNSGTDVYGNALKPSMIDQFELGVKNDLIKGKLSANITGYRIINHNLAQTAQFLPDGTVNNNTAFKELTGQTTSDGVELDITAHPFAGMDVIAGYSYNYMRYTQTPDAKGNYVEGERLVNTPAHTANASIFYNIPCEKLKGFRVGASLFYTGDRFGGWNNTKQQAQQYSRLIEVPGFTTIDVSLGYSFKKFSVLAKASNITNAYNYYVHENYSINPIPPTQFVATFNYKF